MFTKLNTIMRGPNLSSSPCLPGPPPSAGRRSSRPPPRSLCSPRTPPLPPGDTPDRDLRLPLRTVLLHHQHQHRPQAPEVYYFTYFTLYQNYQESWKYT